MTRTPAGHQPWWWPVVALGAPVTVFLLAIALGIPTLEVPSEAEGHGASSSSSTSTDSPEPSEPPSQTAEPEESPSPTPEAPTGPADQALADLAMVPDAGATASGYERNYFGDGWKDPDRNGCDARNDILGRDLVDKTFRAGTRDCVVSTGILNDPYTGRAISFVRGPVSSQDVQIDHLVPLAWAWRYGASTWDETRRVEFANDPINLLAVDGPTNMQKSDLGPSEWLPPKTDYWCEYAIDFTAVLSEYELSVPSADRSALEDILQSCE